MLSPSTGRGPVVLIIPGSGPTDRNGNSSGGILAAPYRLLAEALVARGVTTVRIDKRGLAGSAGATPDGNAVTINDYVSDVHAWMAVIRQQTSASCIWLLGHSEGGLIAMAPAKNQSDICGLILVSTAGRPMGDSAARTVEGKYHQCPTSRSRRTRYSNLEGWVSVVDTF